MAGIFHSVFIIRNHLENGIQNKKATAAYVQVRATSHIAARALRIRLNYFILVRVQTGFYEYHVLPAIERSAEMIV